MKPRLFRRKHLLGASLCCLSLSAFAATSTTGHLLSTPIVTTSQNSKIGQNLQEALNQQQILSNPLSGKKIIANLQLKHIPSNLSEQLSSLGIQVVSVSKTYNQAVISITRHSNVKALTKLPEILQASLVSGKGSGTGEAYDNAYKALNVNGLTKLMPNLTGKGIRVGIISDSFSHTSGVRGSDTTPAKCKAGTLENAKDQTTGDLPAKVDIRGDSCDSSDSGNDEGAAMAEIVHDIAPDAAISFHRDGTTQTDFVNAVNDLCTSKANGGAGADIIVDDTFYYQEPYYQEGIINQAIQNCIKKGVMYFTIAGNDADRDYQFKYKDIDPSVRDAHPSSGSKTVYGDDFQEWPNGSAYMPITIPANSTFRADLTWNQPYISYQTNKVNFPLIDFDLYLFSKNSSTGKMTQVAYSSLRQGKNYYNDPFEWVTYDNTSSSSITLYLAVNHWSGNTDVIPQDTNVPVLLDLRFPEPTDEDTKVGGGITFNAPVMNGHAWTKGAITVGSIGWYWSEPYFSKPEPESLSSKGALTHQFYFNLKGQVDLTTRSKPTLSGVDGGDTTFFGYDLPSSWNEPNEPDGYPNFFGTSAAAPSVAAVAALLKQYAGKDVSNSLIRKALVSTTRDISAGRASKGWDPVSGAGEVNALAAYKYLKKELGK